MIAGLEKIDEGEIKINNQIINDLHPSKRQTAMVFQSYALYPHMNVYENMSFGLKIEKKSKEEIEQRVMEAAKILQIEEYLERKPKVFLFDEPLSNLDAALRVQMRVELAKLHDQLNATMIYVTHDQTEAMTLANDIVVLDQGIVSQNGSPMNLYNNPDNLFVGGFIGSPKMNFIDSKILSKSSKSSEVDIMGTGKLNVPKISENTQEGDSIKIGIRPEHLILNAKSDSLWESKVFVVEKLGSGTYLYLEKEGDPLVVQTDGDTNIKVGDTVKIGFDPFRCHLFDNKGISFKNS